jgi:uncharacterized membrane protein HdeD (DUF308 family)
LPPDLIDMKLNTPPSMAARRPPWHLDWAGLLAVLGALLLGSGLLLAPIPGHAQQALTQQDGREARIQLHFFWSARCPHCLEARPHVLPMVAERPWIELHDLELSRHPENVQLYLDMAATLGEQARSVPAFLFCGEMHVGWHSAETTGAFLVERLEACRARAAANRETLGPSAPETIHLPLLGEIDPSGLSLPVFTVLIAGLDAFNPCAFFVLLFLLGLLAHQRDRRRMLAIGGVFVLVSGLFYFAFMAAWLNLFRMMGEIQWVTLAAALLAIAIALINIKDFFAFKQGLTLSIPESRLPDLYRRGRAVLAAGNLPTMLVATLLLAGAANLYELLCTAGFPMVYTRVLTLNNLPSSGYYLYLALYNLIYVIPLLAIVLAITYALGRRQLTERQGRLLKLMSGVMMLELGVLLLLAPQMLNNVAIAFALLLGAAGVTAAAAWIESRRRY